MKRAKQVLSVLLAMVMLVCAVPLMEAGATSFTPRMTAPERTGYYGTQNSYNPFRTNSDAGNGNCTWYAWGRAYELLGSRPQLSTGNASSWYPTNQNNGNYPYGSTPKLGAIACWSGGSTGAGHVAVVEQINSDGSFVISESSWSAQTWWFRTTTLSANGYHSSGLSFQGFIYIGDFSPVPAVDVSVRTNKKHYFPNETATWSFDAKGASSVHLYIYKDGNKYFEGQFSVTATYSRKMTDTGHYAFHIIAHYPGGDVNSVWNDCNVSDLAAYLPSGRNLIYTGETVDFKFAAPFASSVHLYIYKDGAKFFEGQFNTSDTYSRTIYATGHYAFYIVAHYQTGDEESGWDDFDVVLPNVKTDRNIYQIGETAEFTFHAKGATSLHLYIYKDGNYWFEGQFSEQNKYSRCFDSAANYAGDYYCYIIAHYDSGNYQSENYSFTVVSNHTHSYTSSITQASTCSATGLETFTCSCGNSYTKPIAINPNYHVNTTDVAATASSCIVKGYSAGVYCNDCKQYISGHAEQPLAAHQTTVINAREATYDANGYTGDTYCTVCKQTLSYGSSIPKLTKPEEPTNPTNPPQPTTQQQQQQSGNCKYCGRTHTGFPGILMGFFHSILAMFGLRKK